MNDLCAVVYPTNKDGILDRIAKEVCKAYVDSVICYASDNLPDADSYFVTHWRLLPIVLQQINPGIKRVACLFTHESAGLPDHVESLNLCHSILCESPEGMQVLEKLGVNPDLLHWIPEGGDNESFKPHERTGNGKILVCSSYYPRKNPSLLWDVMRACHTRKFLLLGRDWRKWEGFHLLQNLTVLEESYLNYPSLFADCDVFLSCASLEGGGPNSLIEAMHSNLFPVVSDTGNARQYIVNGYNGFIFKQGESVKAILSLIEKAYLRKPKLLPPYNDVWESVQDFTWSNFANQVKEVMAGVYSTDKGRPFD